MKRKIAQWSLCLLLGVVGGLAFLMLCGEDTPGHPMSNEAFFGTKISAGAILYLCVIAGKYFNRRGWLPEINDPEEDDGWED